MTLGECTGMSQEAFVATADRHHALDFAPAQSWLEKDSMFAQQLSHAVRFETAVPYKQKIRPNNTANTILDFQGRDTRIQLPLSARC